MVTDNNPLTYILTTARLDAARHRWLAALSTYTFKLQYRAGKRNLHADALSRLPHGPSADLPNQEDQGLISKFTENYLIAPGEVEKLNQDIVSAICCRCLAINQFSKRLPVDPITLVESMSLSATSVPDCYVNEDLHGLPVIPFMSILELQEKQRADPVLREGESVLFQMVLPKELRPLVLKSLHDDMGHLGIDRTLDLVRSRFFWPRMARDIEAKINTCDRGVRRKALPERAAPLVNIKTTRPLELICMDYLSLEPDRSNTKDILVLTDHFMKFAVAIPTANQKVKTVAKCLWENFIVCYGIPERLHTDQGPDFESKLIQELCQLTGIEKTRTTPYHPRGNPVERFNRTLLNMLGTLEHKQKAKWKDYVKPLGHAYNCTRNDVTGFTPYELLFGHSPRLPVDIAFGLPVREQRCKSHSQYVEDLRARLEEGFRLASKNTTKSSERNKARFDQRVTPKSLEEGDRVLVRNIRLRGKHKLEVKWETEVYVVVSRAGNLPVYEVQPETNADGRIRTLHRDLLLPCPIPPAYGSSSPLAVTPPRRPHTRSQKPTDVDFMEDLAQEEFEWSVPNIEIQPATFHFTNPPLQSPCQDESHDTSTRP